MDYGEDRMFNFIIHLQYEAFTTQGWGQDASAMHRLEFGDPRVIQDLHDFWMKRDPFEGIVYNPHQSDAE